MCQVLIKCQGTAMNKTKITASWSRHKGQRVEAFLVCKGLSTADKKQ